jgi:hypothetical protein
MKLLFDSDPKEPYVPAVSTLAKLTSSFRSPLAVCKGLVLDHAQRVFHGSPVLCKRRSRASYGVLCDERYDKYQHHNQTPTKSSLDGKYYVTNQIDWFIRKDEVITENSPITHRCSRRISNENPERSWHDTIVMSRLPHDCLPRTLNQGDARAILTITTDLGPASSNTKAPGIEMKRRWLVLGKKFFTAEYELLALVEGESLKVRTRVNGEDRSEIETISASWMFTRDAENGEEI